MRRYPISRDTLIRTIRARCPDWMERARFRRRAFHHHGGYFETDAEAPFWGELKPLYLEIQGGKCAYCDRTLEDIEYGALEMDVEHYRPKKEVAGWPSVYMRKRYRHLAHYTGIRGAAFPEGYWQLAYHPLNLTVCCVLCNRRLKDTFFPIVGMRTTARGGGITPRDCYLEDPDLFYPIGDIDPDDPATCITFYGPFAQPAPGATTRQRERAEVSIDLLHLNVRPELIRGRSRVLCAVYAAYLLSKSRNPDKKRVGVQLLATLQLASEPHSHCATCFLELCRTDPAAAEGLYEEANLRLRNR